MKKLVLLLLVTLGLVLGSVPYEEGKEIGTEGVVETEGTLPETEADEEEMIEEAVQEEASEENIVSDVSDEEEEQVKETKHKETKAEKEPEVVENKGQDKQPEPECQPTEVQNAVSDMAECQPKIQEVESEPVVAVRSYSPQSVVAKVIAKCQAGGMITTTDNLNRLLSDGSISQEEYDEYYPYDGLGYYAVYVETDLNAASTTSGRRLNSEDEIAQYIADMLLLENDPIFNIAYGGTTSTGGTEFYEFICYR